MKLVRLSFLAGFVLAFFVGPSTAEAQVGTLTGVVTDAGTGQPLAGVQVHIEALNRGVLTGENGRFFMVNVPPGTYEVVAQLIGYQSVRRENVAVAIDVTRVVNIELATQAVAVEEIRVEADAVPLIEVNATGASDLMSLSDITNLPITTINEALALRSGFLQVPQNTDVVALAEETRGLSPVRIRGGRAGETLTLLDGVPINNFVFGGPAFQPTPYSIQQLEFIRGGFEAQYGNALSGIINIATLEGGRTLEGGMEYRTTEIAGGIGSTPDDLAGIHTFQGSLSGPIPGTEDRLFFAMAGREDRGASRILEFDDAAFDPRFQTPEFGFVQPDQFDLWRGWRSFGFDNERDVYGKLTFYATPVAKLSVSVFDYQRQTRPFLFDLLLAEGEPVQLCKDLYADDSMCEKAYGASTFGDIIPGSIRQDRRLYTAQWNHTIGRSFYKLTLSRFDQERETCNYFQGVCLEQRFANTNFRENFQAPGVTASHPTAGTGRFFGGEDLSTWMGRADLQSQVSDHHNLQVGVFYQAHDLDYREFRDRGVSDVLLTEQVYSAEPWEAAFYVQDRIEYDFLTVRLGFRVDFGQADGLFFVNPLDPTNGTTAFDVCQNPGAWQNREVRIFNETTGQAEVVTLSADPTWTRTVCVNDRDALEEAAIIATADDFTEAKRRSQFSPRIGISFPVTASSRLFANFGRFSQNPLYNNLYQGTGIGLPAEGTPQGPQLFSPNFAVPFVGNPNLVIEQTTSYEIGYLAELFEDYALQLILFNKDQNGLTGIRTGGVDDQGNQIFDEGVTYGTNIPSYPVLVNQDFTTVRGIEIGISRRLTNHWAFNLNYQFSQATTNAAPPERQLERLQEGDPESFREITSEVDQPHVFNGALRFQVGEEPAFDGIVGRALRHTILSVVARSASGLPYTPTSPSAQTLGFQPDRRALNSARGPTTFQVDLLAQKQFDVGGLRYGAFLQVVNLFDRENCIQVSSATGRCDEGAFDFLRRRVGNPVGEGNISSTSLDRPNWTGQRRQILTGIRVGF